MKLNKGGLYVENKPGSPTSLLLGQLSMWFLGRFISKGFVLLPELRGYVGTGVRYDDTTIFIGSYTYDDDDKMFSFLVENQKLLIIRFGNI